MDGEAWQAIYSPWDGKESDMTEQLHSKTAKLESSKKQMSERKTIQFK